MNNNQSYKGSCHCGNVQFEVFKKPDWLISCNCSLCTRLGNLWAHADSTEVKFDCTPESTNAYIWGNKSIAIHTCKKCGCTTHWTSLTNDITNVGLNFRMCTEHDISVFTVRNLDGADTWEFID